MRSVSWLLRLLGMLAVHIILLFWENIYNAAYLFGGKVGKLIMRRDSATSIPSNSTDRLGGRPFYRTSTYLPL